MVKIEPFEIAVPRSDLDDLRERLELTRWPGEAPAGEWESGVPVGYLRGLADHWRDRFDWRAAERRLNRFPQFMTEIDGADVHLVHVRSPEPDALPLLMTHGWPSSVVEYLDVIDRLTDPRAHGGDPADAFHVVVPSLPGFGFSGPTRQKGWDVERIARAWSELMRGLGYPRYAAHGGDLGVWISLTLAALAPREVLGAHVNFLLTPPPNEPGGTGDLTGEDARRLELMAEYNRQAGYMKVQSTRPQTLAYGLTDSPVGQLAWIAEKFHEWTGPGERSVSWDRLLTNVSVYWLTRTAGSSAQLYFELADRLPDSGRPPADEPPLAVPLGVLACPYDAALPVRSIARTRFPNIVQWSEWDHAGHFPALEDPELFVRDVRSFARALPRDGGR
ncbi:alpha/beta hydrolase [Actinomadura sp. NEAU-AAG7]|nr:alpha/beta hydrolase [Actinomadura sp. NEAU-AAG7]